MGHLLSLLADVIFVGRGSFDLDLWKSLDSDYIQAQFDHQSKYRGLRISFGILNAIGWVILTIPILQVAWLLSSKGTKRARNSYVTQQLRIVDRLSAF